MHYSDGDSINRIYIYIYIYVYICRINTQTVFVRAVSLEADVRQLVFVDTFSQFTV